MTRRVAAALLVLTLALLVAAVVPLALGAIAHERDSFVEDTARTAASIAGIAEERLGDGVADDPSRAAVTSAADSAMSSSCSTPTGRSSPTRGLRGTRSGGSSSPSPRCRTNPPPS